MENRTGNWVLQKRFYTKGTLRGKRISRITKIPFPLL